MQNASPLATTKTHPPVTSNPPSEAVVVTSLMESLSREGGICVFCSFCLPADFSNSALATSTALLLLLLRARGLSLVLTRPSSFRLAAVSRMLDCSSSFCSCAKLSSGSSAVVVVVAVTVVAAVLIAGVENAVRAVVADALDEVATVVTVVGISLRFFFSGVTTGVDFDFDAAVSLPDSCLLCTIGLGSPRAAANRALAAESSLRSFESLESGPNPWSAAVDVDADITIAGGTPVALEVEVAGESCDATTIPISAGTVFTLAARLRTVATV
mmetsp:Transcript_15099/g.41800  ORF Transcript_15099/g.41800 Transcript_15099/m.41800 type:complete len:271 (-) Transcript_15099:81-893(-)